MAIVPPPLPSAPGQVPPSPAMPRAPGLQPGVVLGVPAGGVMAMAPMPGMQQLQRVFQSMANNPAMMNSLQQQVQSMLKSPATVQMMQQNAAAMIQNPMMMQMVQHNCAAMLQNPTFANMVQQNMAFAMATSVAPSAQTHPQAGVRPPAAAALPMDPEVKELCEFYQIEDKWIGRLNDTISRRQATKSEDLAKLWEVLEHARSPTGLLTVKIGEMECGQFVGKIKPDRDVMNLAKKFKLDEHVRSRLSELIVRRGGSRDTDLERLEQHLTYSKRPSGLVMILVGKLLEGDLAILPDLTIAEGMMKEFRLDEDACSKLAEIVLKRPSDWETVLDELRKHLETSNRASAMLCMLAGKIIDGESVGPPPDRKKVDLSDRGRDRGRDRDRDRDRDNDRNRNRDPPPRDRDRDHSRDRSRDRSLERGHDRRRSRSRRSRSRY